MTENEIKNFHYSFWWIQPVVETLRFVIAVKIFHISIERKKKNFNSLLPLLSHTQATKLWHFGNETMTMEYSLMYFEFQKPWKWSIILSMSVSKLNTWNVVGCCECNYQVRFAKMIHIHIYKMMSPLLFMVIGFGFTFYPHQWYHNICILYFSFAKSPKFIAFKCI